MADRKSRKEERLAAAREQIERARRAGGSNSESGSGDGSGPQMTYRGQVVKRPGSGAGSKSAASKSDAHTALEEIKALYRDGLITRAEAEAKRAEILDKL